MNFREEKNIYIELTDISEGMISDARRNIKKQQRAGRKEILMCHSGSEWLHAKRQGRKMNRMIW